MADLLVDSGKHRGRRLKLAEGTTLIGREKGCEIRLATADVSRKHCRLTVRSSGGAEVVTAEDLGSRNGTYINGRAIRVRATLSAGDTLRIGPIQFLLPDPDAASESEVVTWLVPPPSSGPVADDEPTQVVGMSPVSSPPVDEAASAAVDPPPSAEESGKFVLQAAAVIRERHAALAR